MVARQDGAARREAILDAALECFETLGLVHAGIEDIRKAAGASPSSVYHLFKGLPELVAALLLRTFARRYAEVTARVLKAKTGRAAVYALVDAHLSWVFAHPVEARFMYQALALELAGNHREELRATKAKLKAELSAHLQKLGVLPVGSGPEMLDTVLLGVTHQACRTWLATPQAIDKPWMKKALPDLAWRNARAMNRPRSA